MRYLFLLCLFGCSDPAGIEKRDRNDEGRQFPITVHVYDRLEDLKRVAPSSEAEGFANWYMREENMTRCEVHVVRPRSSNDFETWGHELAHCVYGSFHN